MAVYVPIWLSRLAALIVLVLFWAVCVLIAASEPMPPTSHGDLRPVAVREREKR